MTASSPFDSRLGACLVAVVLGVATVQGATAVAIGTLTYDPLRLSDASTPGLDDVLVERWSLDQSSGEIVGVTTAINNTKLTDVSVDVTVRLEKLDGTVVEEETTTVLLGLASVTTVDLTLSQSQPPGAFAGVNVTVRPSV